MIKIEFDQFIEELKSIYLGKFIGVDRFQYLVLRISRELDGRIYFIVRNEFGEESKKYFKRKINSKKMGKIRYHVFNQLIERLGYKSYLEIGLDRGQCFNNIKIENKIGVDPGTPLKGDNIANMTSDLFFECLEPHEKFDLIFIDGLHEATQVEKDIINSLKHLNPDGMIAIHDINPPTKESQMVPKISSPWKGDVWRAFVGFRLKYENYDAFTTQDDTGIGWIPQLNRDQKFVELEPGFSVDMTYEHFSLHRPKYLKLYPSIL